MAVAATIGRKLKGGEVIELVSDLGGGKTAFVRGLAQGLGSRDVVRSPSFTISNQYRAGGLTLYHFDFYRLDDPGVTRDELAEVVADPAAVIVIEWANSVEAVLPSRRLKVTITVTGDTSRRLDFMAPAELAYLGPA